MTCLVEGRANRFANVVKHILLRSRTGDGAEVTCAVVSANAAIEGVTDPLRMVPNVEELRTELEIGTALFVEYEVLEEREVPVVAAGAAHSIVWFVAPGSRGRHGDSFSVAETRNQDTRHLYEFGPYRLDPNERKLLRNNEIVELPPKAFDTLVLMVRNSGHLMEKDELIRTLWPDSFVEEGSLSNSVFLLRKALGEDPQYIETVPKRGYRFVGPVRCLPDGVRGHQEEAKFPVSPPATVAAAAQALPFWRSRPVGGIAALVLFVCPTGGGRLVLPFSRA